MALGTPVDGGAAYSAASGTSVAPAYPAGISAGDVLVLIVGQKPSTANGGTVTTPTGWTLRSSLTGAGGYGATLGADTGNTNLFVYTKDSVTGSETGTLSVTVGTNNVCWAAIIRVPDSGGTISYAAATGQQSTTPTASLSVSLSSASITAKQGDVLLTAMCIPTDVTTPSQFTNNQTTISGLTVTNGELEEPDSTTGNDIGGFIGYSTVTSGTATGTATFTATLAGTLTNVRGPVVTLRINEVVSHVTSGTLTGPGSSIVGSADRQAGFVSHDTSGALTGPGSSVVGAASNFSVLTSSGVITGPGSNIVGTANRFRTFTASGTLVGDGSSITGTASRFRTFTTSGALTGAGAEIVGTANRWHEFTASGSLIGAGSSIVGYAEQTIESGRWDISYWGAARWAGTQHDTAGALTGAGSVVAGEAARSSATVQPVIADIGPGDEKQRKKAQKKRDEAFEKEKAEREGLREQIKKAIDPVVEKAEPVVVSQGTKTVQVVSVDGSRLGITVPPHFDAAEVARIVGEVLEAARVESRLVQQRQDAERARIELARIMKRRRDDEVLLLMD